jgi:hypothetical protein
MDFDYADNYGHVVLFGDGYTDVISPIYEQCMICKHDSKLVML